MTSELNRRTYRVMPAWVVCWFFGLVLLAFAVWEFIDATEFEKEARHPPVAKDKERPVRRSLYAKATEWGYPGVGKWGCVAIFAVPSIALFTAGTLLWRFQRRYSSEHLDTD
jgi:hypothetical protein